MKYQKFTIFVLAMLFLSLVSANFEVGNEGNIFDTGYSPGEFLSGEVNMSFDSELSNSEFTDSFGNSITLLNLLKSDDSISQINYSCNPLNCESDYFPSSGKNSKVFTIDKGQSKILGFKVSGSNVVGISNFFMKMTSTANPSLEKQLTIDIFNDNKIEWKPYKFLDEFGEENYSCFEKEKEFGLAEITRIPYCQKFTIEESPSLKVGANIKKMESVSGDVEFRFGISGENFARECSANASDSGEISCVSDLMIDELTEVFVCIETKNSEDNNKFALAYEQNEPCGYSGSFDNNFDFDFDIFVQKGIYDELGNFVINETELENFGIYNIENSILDYLYERYGGDCGDGCVIPIKFTSKIDGQKIYVNKVGLSYDLGVFTTTKIIYDLEEEPAEITSDYLQINFDDANFSVPDEFGEKNFNLYFNDSEILSQKIDILRKPVIESINPTTTAAALPTLFVLRVDSFDKNITKYDWFFNDSHKETYENEVRYSFSSVGEHNLRVRVTDSEGLSSEKNFTITVETPIDAINKTLQIKEKNIDNIKSNITKYDLFTRRKLQELLNLTGKENELTSIRHSFNSELNSQENNSQAYIDLINRLMEIDIPEGIETTKGGDSLVYYPSEEVIDTSFLYDLTSNSFAKKDIQSWYYENIDSELNFKEISSIRGSSREKIITVFSLNLEKKDSSIEPLIILKELENIEFAENYFGSSSGNYYYKDFENSEELIEFSTTEKEIDFLNLPFFISPEKIERENYPGPGKDYTNLIILIVIVLVLAAILAYILMHSWYKKKYEGSLFKNKNDLYNLITYINNAKRKGISKDEMKHNLRKSRWSSEQVSYVMKKYMGKNTGLPGIPVDKIIEKFKKKKRNPYRH